MVTSTVVPEVDDVGSGDGVGMAVPVVPDVDPGGGVVAVVDDVVLNVLISTTAVLRLTDEVVRAFVVVAAASVTELRKLADPGC